MKVFCFYLLQAPNPEVTLQIYFKAFIFLLSALFGTLRVVK